MTCIDKENALQLIPALRAISAKLDIYCELLKRWQTRINLVGGSTLDKIWTRHFADSAQLAEFVYLRRKWVDLGAGAGFPGFVLAMLQNQNEGEMHLIESDTRKAAFLREVSRETQTPVAIHNARAENVLTELNPDVLTSRAMADMASLFQAARPFVEKGGSGVFLKGRDIGSELTAAAIPSSFSVKLFPSKIDAQGAIVLVRRV